MEFKQKNPRKFHPSRGISLQLHALPLRHQSLPKFLFVYSLVNLFLESSKSEKNVYLSEYITNPNAPPLGKIVTLCKGTAPFVSREINAWPPS